MVGMFFGGLSLGVAVVLLEAWVAIALMEPIPVIGSTLVAIWYVRYTVRYYAAKGRKRAEARASRQGEDLAAWVEEDEPVKPLPTALDD